MNFIEIQQFKEKNLKYFHLGKGELSELGLGGLKKLSELGFQGFWELKGLDFQG